MSHSVAGCLFCKMVQGTVQVHKVYENDSFIAIRDIHPQAKCHLLVIPKSHVASLAEAFPNQGESQVTLIGQLLQTAAHVARQEGLVPSGFRTVINTEKDAGQTVFHLHVHVLGGEALKAGFGR